MARELFYSGRYCTVNFNDQEQAVLISVFKKLGGLV